MSFLDARGGTHFVEKLNLVFKMEYWQKKLNAFDAQLCTMVESLTGVECVPKNGGDHYFIEPCYKGHNDPEFISALWDAIEGRVGARLIEAKDMPERQCLWIAIKFYSEPCEDAAFVPKIDDETRCCICGKPVEIDENGIEDDAGNLWCNDCFDEFERRLGTLMEQMKEEKKNGGVRK